MIFNNWPWFLPDHGWYTIYASSFKWTCCKNSFLDFVFCDSSSSLAGETYSGKGGKDVSNNTSAISSLSCTYTVFDFRRSEIGENTVLVFWSAIYLDTCQIFSDSSKKISQCCFLRSQIFLWYSLFANWACCFKYACLYPYWRACDAWFRNFVYVDRSLLRSLVYHLFAYGLGFAFGTSLLIVPATTIINWLVNSFTSFGVVVILFWARSS